jgi:hypothetical protein
MTGRSGPRRRWRFTVPTRKATEGDCSHFGQCPRSSRSQSLGHWAQRHIPMEQEPLIR